MSDFSSTGFALPGGVEAPDPAVGGRSKRAFDIAVAAVALLLLGVVIAIVAVGILILEGRPLIIRHGRIGRNGSIFPCFKFRTMARDADALLQTHLAANEELRREWEETRKLRDDPRVTPLGAILRKTSLDELPQLLNVLRGEMSIVGPRPIVGAEVARYGESFAYYRRTRPGLTGPWQISGRSDTGYANRVMLDTAYVREWSMWRDIVIVVKTIPAVVLARGSY